MTAPANTPHRPADPLNQQDASKPGAGGTGIVMLNLGGPETLDDVEPFLLRLFADPELLQLPLQGPLGRFIAQRRTPKVRKLYGDIGGGSPIKRWTEIQGRAMCERLDRLRPETAPHRFYIAFRYTKPFSDDALLAMRRDGITRAIAFTQYPQWSCVTTGSSLNELWRAAARQRLETAFEWSIIDRWPVHPGFVRAAAESVQAALAQLPADRRRHATIMFSAHSLPLNVIDRGDSYPQEVGATVHAVMTRLEFSHPYLLCYQSDVGPVRWLGARTEQVIRQLGARGQRELVVVPIAFTSDHIDTCFSEFESDFQCGQIC